MPAAATEARGPDQHDSAPAHGIAQQSGEPRGTSPGRGTTQQGTVATAPTVAVEDARGNGGACTPAP
eukprot:3689623-Lingulodinium_polyedra.AAC.1